LLLLAVVVCAAPLHGQAQYETAQQTNEKIQQLAALDQSRPQDIPLGAGDLLHIDVFDVPELSRDVRVSDSGDITYPLIPGRIPVAGETAFQLEEKLEQLLVENGLVQHPQVSVFVREQNSQPISIVGAVARPMVYQAIHPTSLLELLAAAGGISDDAGSVVIVTRPVRADGAKAEAGGEANSSAQFEAASQTTTPAPFKDQQTITIHLQDLLESGNPVYNIPVNGGDVVSVPRAGVVYVMGLGVAQPGGYVLQGHGEQITVLKALALAHGLTPFAKANNAVIMRSNPATGRKDEIPVHLKQIENRKSEDVPMQSNDILYVPDSTGKKMLAKGTEAALGIGTSAAVYRTAAP